MDNRRPQFDSIGARRVVIPARPVATPPPIRTEVYRTSTQNAPSNSFSREFGRLIRQYAPVLLAIVVGIPLVLTGSSFAMKQVSANRLVAVEPDNSDIPSVSLAKAKSKETIADSKELKALVDKLASGAKSDVYISVRDLKTGAMADSGGGTSITSASLYKLFVANQIYRQVDAGKLSLSKKLPRGKTVAQCLQPMIVVSDNACGAQLGDLLKWGAQDIDLRNQGYNGTSLDDLPRTSSNDVALLYARLYAGRLLSEKSNALFLELLKDQTIVNRLPQGLPTGTEIAHKTGDLYGYMHDAGIVYGLKTDYVVTVMSGPWEYPAQAPAAFKTISNQLWGFFQN
jgi:beta-lactamase class A